MCLTTFKLSQAELSRREQMQSDTFQGQPAHQRRESDLQRSSVDSCGTMKTHHLARPHLFHAPSREMADSTFKKFLNYHNNASVLNLCGASLSHSLKPKCTTKKEGVGSKQVGVGDGRSL